MKDDGGLRQLANGLIRTWENQATGSDDQGYMRLPMHVVSEEFADYLGDGDYADELAKHLNNLIPAGYHVQIKVKPVRQGGQTHEILGYAYWFKIIDTSKVKDDDRELGGVLDL